MLNYPPLTSPSHVQNTKYKYIYGFSLLKEILARDSKSVFEQW